MSNTHSPNLSKTSENTIKHFVKTFCDSANADGRDWAKNMNMATLLQNVKYDEGNKAEVQIEQIESTAPKKKKNRKK